MELLGLIWWEVVTTSSLNQTQSVAKSSKIQLLLSGRNDDQIEHRTSKQSAATCAAAVALQEEG